MHWLEKQHVGKQCLVMTVYRIIHLLVLLKLCTSVCTVTSLTSCVQHMYMQALRCCCSLMCLHAITLGPSLTSNS